DAVVDGRFDLAGINFWRQRDRASEARVAALAAEETLPSILRLAFVGLLRLFMLAVDRQHVVRNLNLDVIGFDPRHLRSQEELARLFDDVQLGHLGGSHAARELIEELIEAVTEFGVLTPPRPPDKRVGHRQLLFWIWLAPAAGSPAVAKRIF